MFCDVCGKKNLKIDKFCENCGKSLEDNHDITVIKRIKKENKFKLIYLVLFLLVVGEYFIYDANQTLRNEIKYVRIDNNDIRNKISSIQEERQRQSNSYTNSNSNSSNSLYVTSWGYDFSGGDRLWGRNGVQLSDGREFYTWLDKESYGTRCYRVFVQGGISGNGSNCSNRLNNNWSVSACGSSQFWVNGSYSDVVNAIVRKCGN